MGDYGGYEGRPRENYVRREAEVDDLWANSISSGINFSKYDNIKIQVSGDNKPEPVAKFSEAGLSQLLVSNISRAGYTTPTPVQKYALPIVMAGRDLMACAQTGSGKTAAFLLPIISKFIETRADGRASEGGRVAPQAVVISPTRELAIQIHDEARKFAGGSSVISQVVYGGTSVQSQRGMLNRGCNILVATPGRLLDFVERGYVSFQQVQFLVLDEADRMLDMGFMPDIRRCVSNPSMPPKNQRQTLMFSATFPDEVQRSARDFLNSQLFLQVGLVGGACTDVKQSFHQASKFEKRDQLLRLLQDSTRNPRERTLIFVKTKRNADFLATYLSEEGLPTTSIHGDRLQREREEALDDFKRGKMPILVATAVAARGLDIKDVMHVVNYDMPDEVEEYVHRIGRTGRVGNTGRATSFFDSREDGAISRPLVKVLTEAGQMVPDWLGMARSGGW
eukprot:GFUD01013443.1.p1 GENE.GFUD01013443.1~~GFUD01013443.1.p1  ORF type:complete len:451 (-),score=91.63 GFUD01013443.1:56-1408(-)